MENMNPIVNKEKKEKLEIGSLQDFDMEYFKTLEGEDGWLALNQENCKNQRYFTVKEMKGEKLGIVGVYDTEDEQNIAHTIVDPKYRGQGLAIKFKQQLISKLGLNNLILTVDLDNQPSIKSVEKIPGIKKISNKDYEEEYHKLKYVMKGLEKDNK